jgi:hypothetical protein
MKKAITVLFLAGLLTASCSMVPINSPKTTDTPIPTVTPTPDPCSPENVLLDIDNVQSLVYEFQDIAYIANFTSQVQLIDPILKLQEVRRNTQQLDLPACESDFHNATIDYMNAVIDYLAIFMAGGDTTSVQSGISNSDLLWQIVLFEYSKLGKATGIEAESLPELGQTILSIEEQSSIQVTNGTDQSVNVRENPDLDASIVAKLEPGFTAEGIARTETSDWIQITLGDVTGWVSTDVVSLNAPIDEIPIFGEENEETP